MIALEFAPDLSVRIDRSIVSSRRTSGPKRSATLQITCSHVENLQVTINHDRDPCTLIDMYHGPDRQIVLHHALRAIASPCRHPRNIDAASPSI